MLGANIFTAAEKEVLYILVTFLLHSNDTVSKIDFIKTINYRFFAISSATNFPDIKAGGTPGPGTVNCPVK